MFLYAAFTDTVLEDIERHVAAHQPERGGALLGPVGMPVVNRFVPDSRAMTTGVTFTPSRDLRGAVAQIERQDRTIELKGMLHSHPGTMDHPSSGDRNAFADSLRGAPWLGRFIVPIVTCGTTATKSHELQLPSGVASVYISEPVSSDGRVDIKPAQVHVLPIDRDTSALARRLGGQTQPKGSVDVDGVVYLSASIIAHGLELQFLFPANYPTQAPIALAVIDRKPSDAGRELLDAFGVRSPSSGPVWLPLQWDLSVAEADRLAHSFRSEATVAAQPADTARKGIRERLADIESTSLASRSVLIVGAGSGGSLTADALVRSGVEKFILIDPDTVGPENLSRSIYRMSDVGKPKATALARHLADINPLVTCQIYDRKLQDIPRETLNELVRGSDLVVAATDDLAAQRTLNHFAYARGVPAIFGGAYAKAHAGEVVFTVPTITKCYQCTTTSRHQDESQQRRTDYGTGRLEAEPALGADIHHIVTASVKLAIGLLQLDDDSVNSSSREMLYGALTAGYNYLILSTVPQYGFFKELFAQVPGQHGYQAVWLATTGDDECTVCGASPVDPIEVSGRAPKLSELKPQGDVEIED